MWMRRFRRCQDLGSLPLAPCSTESLATGRGAFSTGFATLDPAALSRNKKAGAAGSGAAGRFAVIHIPFPVNF